MLQPGIGFGVPALDYSGFKSHEMIKLSGRTCVFCYNLLKRNGLRQYLSWKKRHGCYCAVGKRCVVVMPLVMLCL